MYYILYEGLKIESNEPVYCTVYSVHTQKSIIFNCSMLDSIIWLIHVMAPAGI